MMISGVCASVQAELDGLFAQVFERPLRTRHVSAQAFSKARKGFSADLFSLANARLLELAAPLIDAHRWNGLRVIAPDGSRLQVSTRAGAHLDVDHQAFALYIAGASTASAGTASNSFSTAARSRGSSPSPHPARPMRGPTSGSASPRPVV